MNVPVVSKRGWRLCALPVAVAALTWTVAAQAQPASICGDPFTNSGNGPWDYRTGKASFKIVEDFHFTPKVEALISGQSGLLGGDLDYTLRAVPNHHRALLAVSRLSERMKVTTIPNMRYSVDCWFDRALRFRPDDTTVRMLWAQQLMKTGRQEQAAAHLEEVARSSPDNGFTQYNVGLLFFDLKNYERALEQAHRAEALGFQRPELKQRLIQAGKWREAPPAASAADATPAEPASAASSGER